MKAVLCAVTVLLTLFSATAQAQMGTADRRLFIATTGIEFDPAQADAALSAGANVNARNDAMDDAPLLVLAVKSFARPEAVQWLLSHGANPSLKDKKGKTALDWANQLGMGRQPDGRRVLAALGATAAGDRGAAAAPRAPVATPGRAAAAAPAPALAAAPEGAGAAGVGGAIVPGVYECINQQAMITPMSFGIVDGSTFVNSEGRRGRYAYDAGSATLTLEPGAGQARYKRVNSTLFRPIREDGQLGGFTCPLNRAKNPSRPPW